MTVKTKKNRRSLNKTRRNHNKKGGIGSKSPSPVSLNNVLVEFASLSNSKKSNHSHHSNTSPHVNNSSKKLNILPKDKLKKVKELKDLIKQLKQEREELQKKYKKI